MKKLFFTLSIVAITATGGVLNAEKDMAAQNMAKFMKLLKNHKNEWLKYQMEIHKTKYDLLIAEHDAMFNLKIENIEKYANGTMQEYNRMVLPDIVALHKHYMQKWNAQCMSNEKKAKAIHARQVKEIMDFEKAVGMRSRMVETETTYSKTVTE